MKKLLIGFLTVVSISTFAQNPSEYELGYTDGQNSCAPELWSCSITCDTYISHATYDRYGHSKPRLIKSRLKSLTVESRTRVEALESLLEQAPECSEEIRQGKANCKNL